MRLPRGTRGILGSLKQAAKMDAASTPAPTSPTSSRPIALVVMASAASQAAWVGSTTVKQARSGTPPAGCALRLAADNLPTPLLHRLHQRRIRILKRRIMVLRIAEGMLVQILE